MDTPVHRRSFFKSVLALAGVTGGYIFSQGLVRAATAGGNSEFSHVSPDEFGALGDGVTDDTAAIQKAVMAGLVVRIPGGTYLVTEQVFIPSNRKIVGDGIGVTRIIFVPKKAARVFTCIDASNIEITGITFSHMNNVASCYGILAYLTVNSRQNNLYIHDNEFIGFSSHSIAVNGYNANDGLASGPTNAGFDEVRICNNKASSTKTLVLLYGAHRKVVIDGNTVAGDSVHDNIGIDNYTTHAQISNNVCDGVITVGGGCRDFRIKNNICGAIRVGYMTVTGTIRGGGVPWVSCHNGVVDSNIVEGRESLTYGIDIAGHGGHPAGQRPYPYISTSFDPATRMLVLNNIVNYSKLSGINCSLVNQVRIVNNIISSTHQHGIHIHGCNDVSISSNSVNTCGFTAAYESIKVTGSADHHCCDVAIIENNILNDVVSKDYELLLHGYCKNCIVGNNTIDPGIIKTSKFCIGIGDMVHNLHSSPNVYVHRGMEGLVFIASGASFGASNLLFSTQTLPLNKSLSESFSHPYKTMNNALVVTSAQFIYEQNSASGGTTKIEIGLLPSTAIETVNLPSTEGIYSCIEMLRRGPVVCESVDRFFIKVKPDKLANAGTGKIEVYGLLL